MLAREATTCRLAPRWRFVCPQTYIPVLPYTLLNFLALRFTGILSYSPFYIWHMIFCTDPRSDIWDFTAMSFCDHNIIGNSTFSWWAAWLNKNEGRRIVAPREW